MVSLSSKDRSKRWKDVDIDFTLKRVFNKEIFRPLQREIISAAIDGEDIYIQAATSFGKSLCFQLPAFCSKGVTVVISPLLALVTNQVTAANSLGVPCESITSNTPREERRKIEADLQCGHPRTRLLYVTPELCLTEGFRKVLRQIHRHGQLTRVAIDEAHCISEWGHDFRTAYKELVWLKDNLQCPSVPIMALTATATPQVRGDIYKYLKLCPSKTLFYSTSTARPNIHYEVQYFSESSPMDTDTGDDMFPFLLRHLKSIHQRRLRVQLPHAIHGIIYVPLRALADSLSSQLSAAGIRAQSYHAGLEPASRLKIQSSFLDPNPDPDVPPTSLEASFNIIVATTAFGMGIDMPTVRLVIHYGLPRALESFVQESGRAGRDGKAAQSIILYTREERDRTLFRVRSDLMREQQAHSRRRGTDQGVPPQAQTKMQSLLKMIDYCENTDRCRHRVIADYFGDPSARPSKTTGDIQAEVKKQVLQVHCDFACDVCKEDRTAVKRRKEKGLASDEAAMEFTQRQPIEYE